MMNIASFPVPKIDFSVTRLANGLEVIFCPRSGIPLVHVTIHYRVGSSDEEPGHSGLAHLFEHMMFQGSANVPKNGHGRLIDAAGGRWNASTSKDRTNYHETVPSSHLELALWLEADRMAGLAVTEENFENQRQTVIEEKKQVYDNQPYGKAHLLFDELAYRDWRYAHPIIGYEEDLRRLTHHDAVSFHHEHYHPGNAVLVVAGDFEPDQASKWVERYFAGIPGRDARRKKPVSNGGREDRREEQISDPLAPLPAVGLGFPAPPLGSPEDDALRLLALVLAEGDSSRLYRRFVYDKPWITGLFAGTNHCRGTQVFRVWFQVQSGASPPEVTRGILDELDRICAERVADWELEKARNQVTYRQVLRLERVARIGETLAEGASLLDRPNFANERFERLLALDPEDLRQAAERVLNPDRSVVLFVNPGAKE
ncbi:MAG: pitrilysin family protein [Acidobacteriota bacterium]